MNNKLAKWQDEYLLLDFDHPFLAATLEEELILFELKQRQEIMEQTAKHFSVIKADFQKRQNLQSLSGGEKAALALILYALISLSLHKPVKILLYNMMESLSRHNQKYLLQLIDQADNEHLINIYNLKNGKPEKIL